MAANMPNRREPAPAPEVIDLLSDSDDTAEYARPSVPRHIPTPARQQPHPYYTDPADDDEWAAVFRAADEADAANAASMRRESTPVQDQGPKPLTEHGCLAKVLEVYPDIAHHHVRQMFRAGLELGMPADSSWCDQIIVRILDDGKYPKEREARRESLKRKRQDSTGEQEKPGDEEWKPDEEPVTGVYKQEGIIILQNIFRQVPFNSIRLIFTRERYLYKAYLVLEEAERTYHSADRRTRLYTRILGIRDIRPHSVGVHPGTMERLQKELAQAKKKVERDAAKRDEVEKKRIAEEQNEALARANKAMADCGCCFTEYPTNRMTFCNGDETHFFCYDCAQQYVKSEIGQGKCRPRCMDTSGCAADFSRRQLKAFLDDKTFETLERFQQQEDLRLAGMDDLEECPFCDFKAICLPKEVDREFRCLHEDCQIVSCRLCRGETHTPLTCEQAAKDKKVDVRHKVEEAMTAALIRGCNKCKNKFVKEYGCNKMTCPSCGNLQCYVCSTNLVGYDHFGEARGKCPLYDNTDLRHEDEVKKAEAAALEEIRQDNPDITEDDIKVQVSERVKQADAQRIERGNRPGAFIHPPHFPHAPPRGPYGHHHHAAAGAAGAAGGQAGAFVLPPVPPGAFNRAAPYDPYMGRPLDEGFPPLVDLRPLFAQNIEEFNARRLAVGQFAAGPNPDAPANGAAAFPPHPYLEQMQDMPERLARMRQRLQEARLMHRAMNERAGEAVLRAADERRAAERRAAEAEARADRQRTVRERQDVLARQMEEATRRFEEARGRLGRY